MSAESNAAPEQSDGTACVECRGDKYIIDDIGNDWPCPWCSPRHTCPTCYTIDTHDDGCPETRR